MLLSNDGGRLPKHVGGSVIRMYVGLICASRWGFNKIILVGELLVALQGRFMFLCFGS